LKAITHDFFSVGVGFYLALHIGVSSLLYLFMIVWLAFATNRIIDGLGHSTRGGIAVRSFLTHSLIMAPVWGVAVAIASAYFFDLVTGQPITAFQTLFAIGLGTVLAYSHLLLDALTEGGVYLLRRRVALAHLRYNNPILNGAFAALGVLLVLASLI
jgi:Protein of unknown function (DUF1286)